MIRDETELSDIIRRTSGDLIASRIRQARRENGYSHDQLGERMGGVSRQHLIKLEQAKHRPGEAMLTRIAEATGRSVEWFLVAEDSPFPVNNGSNLTRSSSGESENSSSPPQKEKV